MHKPEKRIARNNKIKPGKRQTIPLYNFYYLNSKNVDL